MKAIVADTYTFYIHNSRDVSFPKRYRSHKIFWDLRDVLFAIWDNEITELVIPKLGTPGYDFEEFISSMLKIGQLKTKPKIKYYELEIAKKS